MIVKLGGWKIQAAPFINVDEEKATIIVGTSYHKLG